MHRVRVEPAGVEVEVERGESVAEAAWRQGYTWPTRCWGRAECMMCFARITDGELAAEPASAEEQVQMRALMPARLRSEVTRLACQLRVVADGLVLEKRGVYPPSATLSTGHVMADEAE